MTSQEILGQMRIDLSCETLARGISETLSDLSEIEHERRAFESLLADATPLIDTINIDHVKRLGDDWQLNLSVLKDDLVLSSCTAVINLAKPDGFNGCVLMLKGTCEFFSSAVSNAPRVDAVTKAVSDHLLKTIWHITQRNIEDARYRLSRRGDSWIYRKR